jgi:hypothetical protein
MKKTSIKTRGKFLGFMFGFQIFSYLIALPGLFDPQGFRDFAGSLSLWYLPYAYFSYFAGLITLYAIWCWYKWGVYGLFILDFLGLLVASITIARKYPEGPIWAIFFVFLIYNGLWLWAIKRKWQSFV